MITIFCTYFFQHYYHASFQELNPTVASVAAASYSFFRHFVVTDRSNKQNSMALEVFCDIEIHRIKLR
jgi:hypothetical protein